MSRKSRNSSNVASQYLAACAVDSNVALTPTRPFSPPTMEWKGPGDNASSDRSHLQTRSTGNSPSSSRRSRASRTPSRDQPAAPDTTTSPFRGQSVFFPATSVQVSGGKHIDDASLTQTSSSLTSSRWTPSSRSTANRSSAGHDGSSIETERISSRSSTPPLLDEDEEKIDSVPKGGRSPGSSWRRRLEGTASRPGTRIEADKTDGDGGWTKKKAPPRQLGLSPPRHRSPPKPLTAQRLRERVQPDLATAPTEVMMNLSSSAPHRRSPDQMTTVSGAATEVTTNRSVDKRQSDETDSRDLVRGSAQHEQPVSHTGASPLGRWPPSSSTLSKGASSRRPAPVYPRKPVEITSLVSVSSTDDSAMTPTPVADFPVGRLGLHVNHKTGGVDGADESRGSSGSFQAKSLSSSVGVETGEEKVTKPPPALRNVFGGSHQLENRDVARKNIHERYRFGGLKKVDEPDNPEDGEDLLPPVSTPAQSPTQDDTHAKQQIPLPETRYSGTKVSSNPFVIRYDGRASPPSERKLYRTASPQSATSSGGWVPAPLSSASGIGSADFRGDTSALSPSRKEMKGVQPVFSPDRVDMDDESPLAKWSAGISPILPPIGSSEADGPPKIMRMTGDGMISLPIQSHRSMTHALASGSARRAALQRRRPQSSQQGGIENLPLAHDLHNATVRSFTPLNTAPSTRKLPVEGVAGEREQQSVSHSENRPIDKQLSKTKQTWPISIVVPTSPSEVAHRTTNGLKKSTEVASQVVGEGSRNSLSIALAHDGEKDANGAIVPASRQPLYEEASRNWADIPKMAAGPASGSGIDSEFNSLSHRQLLVLSAHLAATADDVAPADRYARHGVSGATRVGIDDDSAGDVRSLLSALESSLGSKPSLEAEDDDTVGGMSVESIRSMFEAQAEGDNSTAAKKLTTVDKMRALFESQKLQAAKKLSFSENRNLKDAFAVFEKSGTQQELSRGVKSSSSLRPPLMVTKTEDDSAIEEAQNEAKSLEIAAVSNAMNGRSKVEKNVQKRPTTPIKIESKIPLNSRGPSRKAGEDTNRKSAANKDAGGATPVEPRNTWRSQRVARPSRSVTPSSRSDVVAESNDNGMGTQMNTESTARSVSPHDRWRSQMMSRTIRPVTSTKGSASDREQIVVKNSQDAVVDTSRPVSPHDRWRAQMKSRSNRPVTPSRDVASCVMPDSNEGEKTPAPTKPNSESTSRPISPHDRWRSQMKRRSNRSVTPTRDEGSREKQSVNKIADTPVQTRPTSATISRPISPHDRWRAQMTNKSTERVTPTKAIDLEAARDREENFEDVPETLQKLKSTSSPFSPHNRWKAHRTAAARTTEPAVDVKPSVNESSEPKKAPGSFLSVSERIVALKVQQASEPESSPRKRPGASPTWIGRSRSATHAAASGSSEGAEKKMTPTKSPATTTTTKGTPSTVASTPWKESPTTSVRLSTPKAAPRAALVEPAKRYSARTLPSSPERQSPTGTADLPTSPFPSVKDRISALSGSLKNRSPHQSPTPGVVSLATERTKVASSTTHSPRPFAVSKDTISNETAARDEKPLESDEPKKRGGGASPMLHSSGRGDDKAKVFVSRKPLKSGSEPRQAIQPSVSRTDSDYEDGVTLDLSIGDVSALTTPTCLRSKEDLNHLSVGSSDAETEDKSSVVDVTEGKGPSEASSSQMSEAAAPLIARMRFPRSDDQATALLIGKPDTSNIDMRQGAAWDLNNVTATFPVRKSKAMPTDAFATVETQEWQPFGSSQWEEEPSHPRDWETPKGDKLFTKVTVEGGKSPSHESPSRSRASTPTRRNTSYLSAGRARAPVAAEPAETAVHGLPSNLLLPEMSTGAAVHRTPPSYLGKNDHRESVVQVSSSPDVSSGLSKPAALMVKLRSLKESRIRRHAAGAYHPSTNAVHASDAPLRVVPPSSSGARGVFTPVLVPRSNSASGYASHYTDGRPDQYPVGDDDYSASTKSSTRFGGIKFDELCLELD